MSNTRAEALAELTAEEGTGTAAAGHPSGGEAHEAGSEHEEHGREWLRVGFVALVIVLVW